MFFLAHVWNLTDGIDRGSGGNRGRRAHDRRGANNRRGAEQGLPGVLESSWIFGCDAGTSRNVPHFQRLCAAAAVVSYVHIVNIFFCVAAVMSY